MSRASSLARAFGADGTLNTSDVAGLGALAALNTVGTNQIDDSAITNGKLAADGLDASKLTTGTLPNDRLASGAAVANLGYTPVNKAGDTVTGLLNVSRKGINFDWVEKRWGRQTGTGTFILFTNGSSSTQSGGFVLVNAIYGTPSGSGIWFYKISGNRAKSLAWSDTTGYSGSTPSVFWDGADLKISNSDSSTYFTASVELHNIGNGWNASWGNFPGMT